jgi:hypothetical protein
MRIRSFRAHGYAQAGWAKRQADQAGERSDPGAVGGALRFSQQYISGLGRRNPTIVTIYELATALSVGHMELVRPTEGQ